jgi:hypothetical protein
MALKRHGFLLSSLAVGVAIAGAAVAVLAASTGKTWPHDATPTTAMPQGWSYPFSCCSGIDCREVPDASIVEGARGYEIRATHELIPMSDTRIKRSPDGRFHWCSVAGAADGRTICLFVPPRSF